MKTFLILLSIAFVLIVALGFLFFYRIGDPIDIKKSRSYYRHAWKDKYVHSMMGNWFELSYYEFEADRKTFQVLSEDFAKDANTVFWCGRPQKADPSTFQIDSFQIPKDKRHVYLAGDYGDSIRVIDGALPDSFQPVQINNERYTEWHKDDNAYFLTGKKVSVDYASFKIVNQTISCDRVHVYVTQSESTDGMSRNKVLTPKANRPHGEPKSLNSNYAQIGNTILLSNWKTEFSLLSFTSIDSVSVIDERRIVVNGQLVSDGVLLPNFNVSAFVNLDRDYIRDNQNVYYNNQKIEGADAATFEVPYEDYSKDKNHVYYKGVRVEDAIPSTFVLNYGTQIATDGAHQYKEGKRVQ